MWHQDGFRGLCACLLHPFVFSRSSTPPLHFVSACAGNHERDAPATGDRYYPLQSRTDSGEPQSSAFCLPALPEASSHATSASKLLTPDPAPFTDAAYLMTESWCIIPGGEAGYPYELRLKMPTPTQRSEW